MKIIWSLVTLNQNDLDHSIITSPIEEKTQNWQRDKKTKQLANQFIYSKEVFPLNT